MRTILKENMDLFCDGSEELVVTSRSSLASHLVEKIYLRTSWLEGKDRILMELVFGRGVPMTQIASLMGIQCSSLRRRVRRLTNRLTSREYAFCQASPEKFNWVEREIVRRHFVQGLTLIETARRCGCTRYKAEMTVQKLKRLFEMRRRLMRPAPLQLRGPRAKETA